MVSCGEMSWNEDLSDPVTHSKLLFSSDIEEDLEKSRGFKNEALK